MSGFVIFLVLTAAFALALGLLAAIATMAIRWARKGSASASFIGWALLLPSAGILPAQSGLRRDDEMLSLLRE